MLRDANVVISTLNASLWRTHSAFLFFWNEKDMYYESKTPR